MTIGPMFKRLILALWFAAGSASAQSIIPKGVLFSPSATTDGLTESGERNGVAYEFTRETGIGEFQGDPGRGISATTTETRDEARKEFDARLESYELARKDAEAFIHENEQLRASTASKWPPCG